MLEVNFIQALIAPLVLYESSGGLVIAGSLLQVNNILRKWLQLQETNLVEVVLLFVFGQATLFLMVLVIRREEQGDPEHQKTSTVQSEEQKNDL